MHRLYDIHVKKLPLAVIWLVLIPGLLGNSDCHTIDADGDGYEASVDCDDNNPQVNPGAPESCDGKDNNCNGQVDESQDSDHDGYAMCGEGGQFGDCDDGDPSVYPEASELCDGVDNNCDGRIDESPDSDGDGINFCQGDCDESDPAVHPGAPERCNGHDDDCNGVVDDAPDAPLWHFDADGDTFGEAQGTIRSCAQPPGYVIDGTDCDDADGAIHPGQIEICGDAIDSDCNPDTGCPGGTAFDLSGSDAMLVGEGDNFGQALAIGDLTGDGIDDLVVGGLSSSPAYVFQGPIQGALFLEDAVGEIDAEPGGEPGDLAVAFAGDVDGDGYGDLLVGDAGRDEVAAGAGAAYLVRGPIRGTINLADAAAKLSGERAGDAAGVTVAGAGDVNNDGYADLLVAAPRRTSSSGVAQAGTVYLVFGPVSGTHSLKEAIPLEGEGGNAGTSIASGDFNGDGFSDLLIGAPNLGPPVTHDAYTGMVYLVNGPIDAPLNLKEADARLEGESYCSNAGTAVADAGDVNGDGIDDLLVGAGTMNGWSGGAYLIYGPTAGHYSLGQAPVRMLGEPGGGSLAGRSVASAGDVNGDGRAELLVGAPDDSVVYYEGAAYLMYGDGAGPKSSSDLSSSADMVLQGYDVAGYAGTQLAAGDMNGDGYSDVLVGAPGAQARHGAVYVLYGGPTGL